MKQISKRSGLQTNTYRQAEGKIEKRNRQAKWHTDRKRQTKRQAELPTDRMANRQTNSHTEHVRTDTKTKRKLGRATTLCTS